mgnify:FL=1
MERIQKQIKDTYHKAFYDLLQEKVNENPPDYDWISKLYLEIRDKLTKLLKSSSPLRKEIEESMDPVIFNQMMRNNAFNGTDLFNLISFVFDKIKQLGSPARDQNTDEKKNEIFDLMKNNGTFAQIVPLFIKNSNICIDLIYEDMQNLSKKFSQSSHS